MVLIAYRKEKRVLDSFQYVFMPSYPGFRRCLERDRLGRWLVIPEVVALEFRLTMQHFKCKSINMIMVITY